MTEAVVVAWGLAVGADLRLMAMAVGAVWAPWPTCAAVGCAVVVGHRLSREARRGAEVRFAESVVGELRAGSSTRAALATACSSRTDCRPLVRRLEVGDPLPAAISGLSGYLPTIGRLIESAITVGAGGGRMLPVFEELVVLAATEEKRAEDLKVATAQIRASMWVMVGGPLGYLTWLLITGRLSRLLTIPGGSLLGVVGAVLFLTGLAVMGWMARR